MYRCCNNCGAFGIDDNHACAKKPSPEAKDELSNEAFKLRCDLFFLVGFGADVPVSLLGGKSIIEYLKEHDIGAVADIAGLEMKCLGETDSLLGRLHYDYSTNLMKLEEENKVLRDGLKFECGSRCAGQNPCNARETLAKADAIRNK
jgi:hypothetical protein